MKTKTYIQICLAIAILTSCQLLKKDKLTLKRLSQQEELQVTEQRNILSQQSALVIIDSSHQDFTALLYPKGKFTFTIANGFEGEAEKVLIKGKQIKQNKLSLTQEIKQDSTLTKVNYSNQKEDIIVTEKSRLTLGYNWVWILFIPVCYIMYLFIKKYIY